MRRTPDMAGETVEVAAVLIESEDANDRDDAVPTALTTERSISLSLFTFEYFLKTCKKQTIA